MEVFLESHVFLFGVFLYTMSVFVGWGHTIHHVSLQEICHMSASGPIAHSITTRTEKKIDIESLRK